MNRIYDIKPIPTEFRGIKYKSRLEARWAVFFATLEIEALYEYEGYQLPTRWYVPDFYVPSMNKWFEVKPTDFTDEERSLCLELATFTLRDVILLVGNLEAPNLLDYSVSNNHGFELISDYNTDIDYCFCTCPKCGKVGITFNGRGARVCGSVCLPNEDKCYTFDDPRIVKAFSYARRYQFTLEGM